MKTINKIFTVSLIAIASATAANAKIVSESMLGTGYSSSNTVKDAIATKQNKVAAGTAGNVVTYSGTEGSFGTSTFVKQDGYSAGMSGKDTSIPSVATAEYIALTAVGNAVPASYTGDASKNKALITDDEGNVILSTIATGMIADSAVTSAKIADLNVTTGKLAAGAVTTAKITDGNVTADKLASDSVTTAKIAEKNVTAPKIADNVVKGDGIVTVTRDADSNFVVSASHQDISGKADKATNLTGATKTKITYNSQGIVTGGADLAVADLPADAIVSGSNVTVSRNAANATSNPNAYTVSVSKAASDTLGVVKGGGNVAIANDGTMSVDLSGKADKATNLTGATKTKITYNSQGIVTGGADLAKTDIPSGLISGTAPISASRDGTSGVVTISASDASKDAKGVVKVGSNISVSSGTISVSDADASTKGVGKLYTSTGSATDGSMTQNAITTALGTKQDNLPAYPTVAPTTPDGVYVLTAKKVDTTVTYAWEDIGR